MAVPSIPVETAFCKTGLYDPVGDVIAGKLPLAALCGDGVGHCTCRVHSSICMERFMAMNVLLSSVEQIALVKKVMSKRAIPSAELQRLLKLNPALQLLFLEYPGYHDTLRADGDMWLRAFLSLDTEFLGANSQDVPLELSSCIFNYMAHLKCASNSHTCCGRAYCPMNAVKTAFISQVKLPAELCELIFSFI